MANQFYTPYPQFFDNIGVVLQGGYLQFYETGTSTPRDTYSNAALTTPNPNPVELDAAGRPATRIFLDPSLAYKVELYDRFDQLIWTGDPVADPAANVAAAITIYNGNPNGNVAGNAGTLGGAGASMIWDVASNLLYICTTTGDATAAVWTQVGANLAGAISFTSDITPASLGANQNNYAPTSFSTAAIVRQNSSLPVNITGLDGGTDGRILIWENISTTAGASQTFIDESTASLAVNRFAIDADFVLLPGHSVWLRYDGTLQRWKIVGSQNQIPVVDPGGRLTLTTGTPVSGNVTAAATIYYSAFKHSYVPLWNGYAWYLANLSADLSQTLADNTKSPAAAASNSVYDMFIWNDAGVIRCTRGPAWSSATARGTGVGTTELERVNGRYVNRYDITNGPAAQRGLYVGTIATNASTQLAMNMTPAAAAGGTGNRLDVWNMYNRVVIAAQCRPNDNSWTYTTATWRQVQASANMQVTYVCGLAEDAVQAEYGCVTGSSGGANARVGIGIDVTNAYSGRPGLALNPSTSLEAYALGSYWGLPGLGRHVVAAIEQSDATAVTTWYGDNGGGAFTQACLQFTLPM